MAATTRSYFGTWAFRVVIWACRALTLFWALWTWQELPGAEGHQQDEHGDAPDQGPLLDPLHPGPLGHLGREQVELLDRLVRLGQGQADGRGEHGADLVHLLLGEVELRRVEPGQRRDRQHREADLVLEHGEEPVEVRAATGHQHPRHRQATGQRGEVLDRVPDLADQLGHAGLRGPLGPPASGRPLRRAGASCPRRRRAGMSSAPEMAAVVAFPPEPMVRTNWGRPFWWTTTTVRPAPTDTMASGCSDSACASDGPHQGRRDEVDADRRSARPSRRCRSPR